MAKPFTGLTASVKIGGDIIAYVSGVDLSLEKDIIEILAFGMQYKEKVPAIKDWSASIDGTVALEAGGTQEVLYNGFESGAPLTIGVFLDDTNYFEGTGYASSFNINAAPDDKINLSSEIAGSGALLLTLAGGNTVTFTVTSGGPVEDATVIFNGQTQLTNSSGVAVFTGVADGINKPYTVHADGKTSYYGSISVDGDEAVTVTLS